MQYQPRNEQCEEGADNRIHNTFEAQTNLKQVKLGEARALKLFACASKPKETFLVLPQRIQIVNY